MKNFGTNEEYKIVSWNQAFDSIYENGGRFVTRFFFTIGMKILSDHLIVGMLFLAMAFSISQSISSKATVVASSL